MSSPIIIEEDLITVVIDDNFEVVDATVEIDLVTVDNDEPDFIISLEGTPGPQGSPGIDGELAPIVFSQPTASTMWHIIHNQGFDPSIVVRRSDGVNINGFGAVYSSDSNTVDLYFGLPISGSATLNF